MTEAVIIDAIRTPIGALGGILSSVRPDDMAALVIKEIVQRNKLDPALVEEVFLGCANQAGEDNRNIARTSALLAGLPVEVAGVTVNRLCASGLNAINQAARAIKAGEGDVYIAGGVESMSRAPYSLPKAESGYSFGDERNVWHRLDGRDCGKYCQGPPTHHARKTGCLCRAQSSMRNCCH